MKMEDALAKASKSENVQKLKGYFLGSVFASVNDFDSPVEEWTLLYFKPSTKTIVDCFVSDRAVTVGEETPAISEVTEFDAKTVKTGVKEALSAAKARTNRKTISVLISLHSKDGRVVWTIAAVTEDFSVTSFDVSAEDGKILKEETTKLIRKL